MENDGIITQSSAAQEGAKYTIMLVDDSSLIRAFLRRMLSDDKEIKIVAEAENGKIAVETVANTKPDIILLDIEMSEMDGITALPQLRIKSPQSKIIMVSTLTKTNASISIKALLGGATAYIEKPTSDMDKEQFKFALIQKIKAIAQAAKKKEVEPLVNGVAQGAVSVTPDISKVIDPLWRPDVLAIGCSTGGPQTLIKLFKDLQGKLNNIPIFITQHMPPIFTTALAEKITEVSGLPCFEGANGMIVEAGKIYLAPGDFHMVVEKKLGGNTVKLTQDALENFCRPAVDPMLRSIANAYGKQTLVLIMTGMGQDGLEGVKIVTNAGGKVIIQDEASSVVWGMPGAIAKANLYSGMYPMDSIAKQILKICKGDV